MQVAENDGTENIKDDANTGATDDQISGETLEQSGAEGDQSGEVDDEVVVTIGEETPPSEEEERFQAAPEWVKDVRKASREKDRKIRDLEQKLAAAAVPAQQSAAAEIAKPTLEGCEFDEDTYAEKLIAWNESKRQADDKKRKESDAQKVKDDAFQGKLTAYNEAKTTSKVGDFDESEAVVSGLLNPAQQGVLINCAKAPVHVVAALGKNPAEAQRLASITDLAMFAYALAELESKLKVTPRKAPPPPEKHVRGSAPVLGGGDATLERLRDEAAKSGDLSKVIAYKRQKRAA